MRYMDKIQRERDFLMRKINIMNEKKNITC